jgi:hypothetical protein
MDSEKEEREYLHLPLPSCPALSPLREAEEEAGGEQ